VNPMLRERGVGECGETQQRRQQGGEQAGHSGSMGRRSIARAAGLRVGISGRQCISTHRHNGGRDWRWRIEGLTRVSDGDDVVDSTTDRSAIAGGDASSTPRGGAATSGPDSRRRSAGAVRSGRRPRRGGGRTRWRSRKAARGWDASGERRAWPTTLARVRSVERGERERGGRRVKSAWLARPAWLAGRQGAETLARPAGRASPARVRRWRGWSGAENAMAHGWGTRQHGQRWRRGRRGGRGRRGQRGRHSQRRWGETRGRERRGTRTQGGRERS
jgi:hypothetical protein